MHIDARIGGVELLEHARHHRVDDVMRHAEAQLALVEIFGQPPDRLVIQREDAARIAHQLFARRGERHPPVAAIEERQTQHLLQPLDLHRHGGLREVEHRRRPRHAAMIGHGHKGPQRGDIQISHSSTLVMQFLTNIHFQN